MELISFEGFTTGSIIAGILTTPLVWLCNLLLRWMAKNRLVGRVAFAAANNYFGRITLLFTMAAAIERLVTKASPTVLGYPLDGANSALIFLIITLCATQFIFAKVGIHSAQLSVVSGTDYRASLNLCRNGFWFLGTGASKLTSAKNFEETILRCSNASGSVRFLLSTPNNKIIAEAELRSGVVVNTYKQGLVSSLKVLSALQKERAANFEVRFYEGESAKDFEDFRMMFIDGETLLLSYNVYGRDRGLKTPQLILKKSAVSSETSSFYYAYQSHYERLWTSSKPWDFQEYV